MKGLKFMIAAFVVAFSFFAQAQESALWLRYPAISPDGNTIVFCHKGDIFKVPANGGKAIQLTTNAAYDFAPIWSPDGKQIAFSSNRYGSFDIYTMPIEGGAPTRLTFWSGHETPLSFSRDGKNVYFSTIILNDCNYSQFRNAGFTQVYEVSTEGGRPQLFSPVCMNDICFNNDGSKLLYHDKKGYEDEWRKHHTSSVTRDVWMYDVAAQKHTKISDFVGENRNPLFVPNDENSIYYLNEKSGSFNVYKRNLSTNNEVQLTSHTNHPVRFLSVADNGTMCYSFDGELYTLKENGQPKKLSVAIAIDDTESDYKIDFMKGGITTMAVAPSGKEIAFIIRGDVYVTSADYETTVRITNTPEQERNINFSPDGRMLVYSSERNGCWNVYTSEIVRKEDKMFIYANEIKEKAVTEGNIACFQPSFSPDGKEIAYLENRTTLKVINWATKATRTILDGKYNYSYSDGDQYYEWSPDGKWFAVNFFETGGWNYADLGMVKADGSGEIHNLTESGYGDNGGTFVMDGNAIMWYSDKNGYRSHGSWGSEEDIYIMFFNQESFDKFKMSKEEAALLKEQEEAAKKEETAQEDDTKKDKKDKKDKKSDTDTDTIKLPEITYDFENIEDRVIRMTVASAQLGSSFLNKEGTKLYYFAAFEKGYDLWERDFRENTTKLIAKLGTSYASLQSDKEKEKLFMLSNGQISLVETDKGSTKPVSISAEFNYRPAQEREYIFNHAWQQVQDKFYDPNIHGIDWKMYHDTYARFLPFINNNFDFAEMLSEMLGELNASHTGSGYRYSSNGDNTAVFGMFFDPDFEGDGLKIVEILEKNPITKASSKIKEGVIIQKIDGNEIKAGEDYFRFLNKKTGKTIVLTLSDGATQWEERVKPISRGQENELLYQRWVKQRELLVDSLSGGKVGYVHVRGMDSPSFRKVYSKVLGKFRNKEAIVIDTRFNGGGWLHDDLATLFSGKRYADLEPRGQYIASEPMNKWTKPSCVVINESNYSDAHGFPFAYKALNIGKLVGMPVPGTMT
ncbi:MAG: S41 family peptidase, partial [Bacteroidales bacterium]|nr:S41 family peptidase [Bacteroidales bacterium]